MSQDPRAKAWREPSRPKRGAFTLLEVLLSIAIMAVLLGATVSMLFMAQRAIASGATSTDALSQESRIVQMITTDVSLAISFAERTDKAITMVVPDRDGDGQNETIRYAWSGTAGDPLTRQINGGTAVTVAANVYQLKLTYLLKTLSP